MAQYFIKSTAIANRDATPKLLTDAYVQAGTINGTTGYVQTGSAADAVGSVYRLFQVPSNARVVSVTLQAQAVGGAINVGVYYPTFIPQGANLNGVVPGSVINAAYFAAGQSLGTAVQQPLNIVNQSGSNTIQNQELCLWQALGMAADPMIDLDVCATVSTVTTAQGYLKLNCEYCKQ